MTILLASFIYTKVIIGNCVQTENNFIDDIKKFFFNYFLSNDKDENGFQELMPFNYKQPFKY